MELRSVCVRGIRTIPAQVRRGRRQVERGKLDHRRGSGAKRSDPVAARGEDDCDPIGQPEPHQTAKEPTVASRGRRDRRVIRRVDRNDEHRTRIQRARCPLQRPSEQPPQVSFLLRRLDDQRCAATLGKLVDHLDSEPLRRMPFLSRREVVTTAVAVVQHNHRPAGQVIHHLPQSRRLSRASCRRGRLSSRPRCPVTASAISRAPGAGSGSGTSASRGGAGYRSISSGAAELGEHILRRDAPMPAWHRLLTDQVKQPPGRVRAAARRELVRLPHGRRGPAWPDPAHRSATDQAWRGNRRTQRYSAAFRPRPRASVSRPRTRKEARRSARALDRSGLLADPLGSSGDALQRSSDHQAGC